MRFKVKIFHIYIYLLMYKQLYNMTLNLDVAFLLSVSIVKNRVLTKYMVYLEGKYIKW